MSKAFYYLKHPTDPGQPISIADLPETAVYEGLSRWRTVEAFYDRVSVGAVTEQPETTADFASYAALQAAVADSNRVRMHKTPTFQAFFGEGPEYVRLTDWMDTHRKQWESADGMWMVQQFKGGMTIPPSWRVFKNGELLFKTMEHREVLVAVGNDTLGSITQ